MRFDGEQNKNEKDVTKKSVMGKFLKQNANKRRKRRGGKYAKKRFPFAVIALLLAIAAILLLCVVGGNLLVRFLNKTANSSDITLVMRGVAAVVIIATLSALFAILSLILRRAKKASVTALVPALVVAILSLCILGGYEYMFGKMGQDSNVNNLTDEQLNAVQPNQQGEIVRQDAEVRESSALEEALEVPEDKEITRLLLSPSDIPEEARKMMNSGKPTRTAKLLDGYDQVTNFLVFGLDKVDSSDSTILVSVDRLHHKIKLTSIARDSYVLMPQWGSYAKLTYAYSWGGAELAIRTINTNFSLNITDYVAVNFDQMAEIVDYIGGVNVELSNTEAAYLGRFFGGINSGLCHLDGDAALAFSRMRHSSASDNELQRTGRQRKVLISMMETVKQMPYTAYPQLIRDGLGMCQTTYESSELLELCLEIVQNNYTVEQHAFPGDEIDYWDGIIDPYFYVVYDLNRASDMIYSYIYEEYYIPAYDSAKMPEGGATD